MGCDQHMLGPFALAVRRAELSHKVSAPPIAHTCCLQDAMALRVHSIDGLHRSVTRLLAELHCR